MDAQVYLNDKSKTWELFDQQVSKHYDRISDLISFGLYKGWRKALAKQLPQRSGLNILDLATGTGAIPLSMLAHAGDQIERIVGVDLSEDMMDIFRERLTGHARADDVEVVYGDATALELEPAQFDVVTMGCGIRNVSDHNQGCAEIFRMLKPGGQVLFLEPSMPTNAVAKAVYLGYFRHVVPSVAGLISNYSAYRYFCDSVEGFLHGDEFVTMLESHGFENGRYIDLTFGAIRIYSAEKPSE